jgi:hypothetical protein
MSGSTPLDKDDKKKSTSSSTFFVPTLLPDYSSYPTRCRTEVCIQEAYELKIGNMIIPMPETFAPHHDPEKISRYIDDKKRTTYYTCGRDQLYRAVPPREAQAPVAIPQTPRSSKGPGKSF